MPTVVIKPGATIFVTGVNGLIGSHIADQLLARGYNVRGAVRDVEKTTWLTKYFAGKHKDAKFELVSVPDMTIDGCYDDVVKGTDGFIHVASPLNGEDPKIVIPTAVNGALNALKASAKTPGIKRVVYTSSSIAATFPKPNVQFEINDKSWNEEGITKGWNHPKDEPEILKGLYLYAALKTETEKACWKWVEENKPGFVFNSILPNANYSKLLVPEKQGAPSTIDWAKAAFDGGEGFEIRRQVITPQYFVATQDCALIHIGALIYSDVHNERLLAFAETFNWNQILSIYRKLYPNRKFSDDKDGEAVDKSVVRSERAEEVLKWMKGAGWTKLEDSVKEMRIIDFLMTIDYVYKVSPAGSTLYNFFNDVLITQSKDRIVACNGDPYKEEWENIFNSYPSIRMELLTELSHRGHQVKDIVSYLIAEPVGGVEVTDDAEILDY